jgi:hypothetical protein
MHDPALSAQAASREFACLTARALYKEAVLSFLESNVAK